MIILEQISFMTGITELLTTISSTKHLHFMQLSSGLGKDFKVYSNRCLKATCYYLASNVYTVRGAVEIFLIVKTT